MKIVEESGGVFGHGGRQGKAFQVTLATYKRNEGIKRCARYAARMEEDFTGRRSPPSVRLANGSSIIRLVPCSAPTLTQIGGRRATLDLVDETPRGDLTDPVDSDLRLAPAAS